MTLPIPAEAVRLNKSFEGFHKKRDDGQCEAYQTLLGYHKVTKKPIYDIPTCGFGTTKNVRMGMVWTEEYATQRMMEDLAEAAAFVDQYVKVPINENERGALILFTNNCGPGNLKNLAKRLNKGKRAETAQAFHLYNKAQGIVLPGLVSRRAREAALFLKPTEAPAEPVMPQTVSSPPTVSTPVAVGGTVAAGTTAGAAAGVIPVPPVEALGILSAWQTAGEQTKSFISSPIVFWIIGGLVTYWIVCHALPKWAEKQP